jgi:hypothetical protein
LGIVVAGRLVPSATIAGCGGAGTLITAKETMSLPAFAA